MLTKFDVERIYDDRHMGTNALINTETKETFEVGDRVNVRGKDFVILNGTIIGMSATRIHVSCDGYSSSRDMSKDCDFWFCNTDGNLLVSIKKTEKEGKGTMKKASAAERKLAEKMINVQEAPEVSEEQELVG